MHSDRDILDTRLRPHLGGGNGHLSNPSEKGMEEDEEESCLAFGFLRGLHASSPMIEFRFRNGNTESYPYHWLGPVRFNPSTGLLLKFTSDVTTLVLIRGSNLDLAVKDRAVNLIDRGILRHRVTWVREMDEDELRKAGKGEATIDRIEVADFESQNELREWLQKAPQHSCVPQDETNNHCHASYRSRSPPVDNGPISRYLS